MSIQRLDGGTNENATSGGLVAPRPVKALTAGPDGGVGKWERPTTGEQALSLSRPSTLVSAWLR